MEWIVEGVRLIFIGLLVAAVTLVDPTSTVSKIVYWACFAELNVLSIVSLLTGFKVNFLPFQSNQNTISKKERAWIKAPTSVTL